MYCSYCRRYEEGDMQNPDDPYDRGHELCSDCYKKWKDSGKEGCPMCQYEGILHMRRSLGKEWMEGMIKEFKKRYGL